MFRPSPWPSSRDWLSRPLSRPWEPAAADAMRWIRLLFRIFGWLLTPFLAWAASFFGAVGGALIAMRMEDPVRGLAVMALCGALTGFAALIGWLEYLRRSPEVREVLAVTEDGTPDTTDILIPEPASDLGSPPR